MTYVFYNSSKTKKHLDTFKYSNLSSYIDIIKATPINFHSKKEPCIRGNVQKKSRQVV